MSRTVLRPWTEQSTWWSLVHLLCGLFVGYMVAAVVFVGAVLTLSTLFVFPIAIAASWVALMMTHGLARLERSRYRALLETDLSDPNALEFPLADSTATDGRGRAIRRAWAGYRARLTSASRWREVLYLTLRLPASLIEAMLLVILWPGAVVLVSLPFLASRLPTGSADFGPFSLSSGIWAWLATLVGLATLAFLAPWATIALAQADIAFGRWLLAHGSRTEMEQTVDRLETSRAAAIDGAEAERRRIERDLHDGAQQRLIAAAMDLGVAKDRLGSDPEGVQQLLDRAHGEVKSAMRELRDLVRGIHPVILEDRGLDAALSAVVARVGMPVTLSVSVDPRPAPAVESAAYFIVCEALTNVTRHSGASRASVEITGGPDNLRITIIDDGIGGANPSAGTGLSGLAERAASLGGTFRLSSPDGGPTAIEVELP